MTAVPGRRLVLLCLLTFSNTFSIGAFPPLLPEIGAAGRLSDAQLGAVAAMFGFVRMIADIPVGLFVGRHLRTGLVLGPLVLTAGVLCLTSGGPFGVILFGRALVGFGQGLSMLAGLTTLLRYHAGPRLGAALNSFELSAMLGILGGVGLLGALPGALPWNRAFLLACAPQFVGVLVLPWLAGSIPSTRATPAGPSPLAPDSPPIATPARRLVTLAFVTGAAISLTYSTVENFLLPIRGSREFGLDRAGIARLLQISQVCDIVALLPVGVLSDRRGADRVVGAVVLVMAAGTALVGFGSLPLVAIGCALFGLSMAGWMLPLSLLRQATAPEQLAWRTSLYRVGVDGGIFLGPFVSGLLGVTVAAWLPALFAVILAAIGLVFLMWGRATAEPVERGGQRPPRTPPAPHPPTGESTRPRT